MCRILVVCTTDSMIWNFLIPHIKELEKRGNFVECACSETGFYYKELEDKYGLQMNKIPFKRSPFKFSNFNCYKTLKKLIKEHNIDWLYCHEPVGGALGRLAGKSCKRKTVYIAHGFHFFKGASPKHWLLYRTFEWLLSFRTDVLVTINKEDFENSKKLHAKSNYLIPGIGIDLNKFDSGISEQDRDLFRKEHGISAEDYVFISVGELSVRKNHMVVLKALEKLNRPNIHFVLCGEGGLEKDIVNFCKKRHLEKNVHLLGFRKDINKVLRCCDAFIFPSLWEGLGLAGMEAMYSGLPIIGSNRRGIRDYVIDGQTGFAFEPKEVDGLCNCMRKTMEMEQKQREKMIQNERNIIENFSLEKSIAAMSDILAKEGLL